MKNVRVLRSPRGFSAIELLMTLGIFGTVSAMAVFQIGIARPGIKGDGAMRTVMAQLNTARELALTQRRNIRINFINTNQIQLIRQEVPIVNGTTVLSTIDIEGGITYGLTPGLPDTPDGFGNASGVDFGAAVQMVFNSDGTLVNQSGTPISGSIFMSIPGQSRSSRAVTILGATGRVRGYKWNSRAWVRS